MHEKGIIIKDANTARHDNEKQYGGYIDDR
jgi:hypothetical protein